LIEAPDGLTLSVAILGVALGLVGAGLGFALLLTVTFVFQWVRAPYRQRNEARAKVAHFQPVCDLEPIERGDRALLKVTNRGVDTDIFRATVQWERQGQPYFSQWWGRNTSNPNHNWREGESAHVDVGIRNTSCEECGIGGEAFGFHQFPCGPSRIGTPATIHERVPWHAEIVVVVTIYSDGHHPKSIRCMLKPGSDTEPLRFVRASQSAMSSSAAWGQL
jgi:hypothetical protein